MHGKEPALNAGLRVGEKAIQSVLLSYMNMRDWRSAMLGEQSRVLLQASLTPDRAEPNCIPTTSVVLVQLSMLRLVRANPLVH